MMKAAAGSTRPHIRSRQARPQHWRQKRRDTARRSLLEHGAPLACFAATLPQARNGDTRSGKRVQRALNQSLKMIGCPMDQEHRNALLALAVESKLICQAPGRRYQVRPALDTFREEVIAAA